MNLVMILAGGSGTRAGFDVPKQFVKIFDKPVLAYTIEIFEANENIDKIQIVCNKQWLDKCKALIKEFNYKKVCYICEGGEDFQASVINGINQLKNNISPNDKVLVHYAASPFASQKIINSTLNTLDKKSNAVSITPCFQLMGKKTSEYFSQEFVNRDDFVQIASPFGFKFQKLVEIYEMGSKLNLFPKIDPHTSSLMFALNEKIYFSYGEQSNIKITTKDDIELFKAFIFYKKHFKDVK